MIVPKKRSLYRYAVDTFIDLLYQVQKRSTAYRCNDIDTTCWNKFVDIYSDRGLVITKEFVKNTKISTEQYNYTFEKHMNDRNA